MAPGAPGVATSWKGSLVPSDTVLSCFAGYWWAAHHGGTGVALPAQVQDVFLSLWCVGRMTHADHVAESQGELSKTLGSWHDCPRGGDAG